MPSQSTVHPQNAPPQLKQHGSKQPPLTQDEGQLYSRDNVPHKILSKEEQEERDMLDAQYQDIQEARQRQMADPTYPEYQKEKVMVEAWKSGRVPRPWQQYVKSPDNMKLMVQKFLATITPTLTPMTMAARRTVD